MRTLCLEIKENEGKKKKEEIEGENGRKKRKGKFLYGYRGTTRVLYVTHSCTRRKLCDCITANRITRVISNDNNVLEKFRSHGISPTPIYASLPPGPTVRSSILLLSFFRPLLFSSLLGYRAVRFRVDTHQPTIQPPANRQAK